MKPCPPWLWAQVAWTWVVFLGAFQLRISHDLLKEKIPPFLGSRQRSLTLKRKRWTAVPLGKEQSCDSLCSCAFGISHAPRAHGKVSAALGCAVYHWVIYCFQLSGAHKAFIPSFPIYSEAKDSWEKLGPSPISTKAVPPGWMEHLAHGNKWAQGEGHLQLQTHPAPPGFETEADGICSVWNNPLHKRI